MSPLTPTAKRGAAVCALAAIFVIPSPASASDVTFSPGSLLVGDIASQDNEIHFSHGPGSTHIRVSDVYNVTGFGCTQAGATAVDCPAAGLPVLYAILNSGADELTTSVGLPIIASGGPGSDALTGGGLADTLIGGDGNDDLTGGAGDDTLSDKREIDNGGASGNDDLRGEAGADYLDGGSYGTQFIPGPGRGADLLDGGADVDTIDYSLRSAALTITESVGSGNDGQEGEGDTVANAEKILLGSGNDTVTGSSIANTFEGNGGNDTLGGGAGTDSLHGGAGDDKLDGGTGADELVGDGGADTADYSQRVQPVSVTLDDDAGDGESGEGDRVDAEIVEGGFVADTLTGSSGADTLRGNVGTDTIDGRGGDDVLSGGDSADTITGGSGDDSVDGGDGGDTVLVRDDSVDTVVCGPGTDVVTADLADVVNADCETVDRPAVLVVPGGGGGNGPGGGGGNGGGGGAVTPPDTLAPALTLPAAAKIDRTRRLLTLTVTCPAAEPTGCRAGRLSVSYTPKRKKGAKKTPKAKTLKAVVWTAAGGDRVTISVPLSKGQVAELRAAKKASLSLTARDAAGNAGSAKRTVRVG